MPTPARLGEDQNTHGRCAPSPVEWHRRVAVIVARHPAQTRVVSAEVGERRRAGNRIRHVIVAAFGMRNGVPANRAGATLKPDDLALRRSLRGSVPRQDLRDRLS